MVVDSDCFASCDCDRVGVTAALVTVAAVVAVLLYASIPSLVLVVTVHLLLPSLRHICTSFPFRSRRPCCRWFAARRGTDPVFFTPSSRPDTENFTQPAFKGINGLFVSDARIH